MTEVQTSKVDCPRCSGYVLIPVLSVEERAYVAGELRKSDSRIQWIKWLREWAGFDIADAKRFVNHFSPELGSCAHCRLELPVHSNSLEYVICPRCKSLNLDWKTPEEIFPYVSPQSIAYMWDGTESGWVIAKQTLGDGDAYFFFNLKKQSILLVDAEIENYLEFLDTARQNGIPQLNYLDIIK